MYSIMAPYFRRSVSDPGQQSRLNRSMCTNGRRERVGLISPNLPFEKSFYRFIPFSSILRGPYASEIKLGIFYEYTSVFQIEADTPCLGQNNVCLMKICFYFFRHFRRNGEQKETNFYQFYLKQSDRSRFIVKCNKLRGYIKETCATY